MNTVGKVIELLKDPKEMWEFDNHTAINKVRGLSVWIANVPVLNTNLYHPCELNIGLIDRWRLWQAVKVARENRVSRALQSK